MRYIDKFKINGTEYSLLGFSSYDFLPSEGTGAVIYSQSGNQYPYGMTAGYSFSTDEDLFPSLTSEGISHYLDDYPQTFIKKYNASGTIIFGLYNDNSNTPLIQFGYLNNSSEYASENMLGIILDDENQIGWAIQRLYYLPSRQITSIACNGGNNAMGELIYSIFGKNGGGAGSGYIGNSLVSDKKMVGYNVPTSSAESTKTESVNEASATPISGKPKIGNGFARIKFISDLPSGGSLKIFAKALDTTNVYTYQDNEWWNNIATCFSSYLGSNYILECIRAGGSRIDPSYDGESIHIMNKFGVSEYLLLIPIRRLTVNKLSMTGYTTSGGSYRGGYVNLMKIENNQLVYCSPSEALFQLPAVSATCEKTLNTPVEADYLSIQAGDGEIYISDVYFNE